MNSGDRARLPYHHQQQQHRPRDNLPKEGDLLEGTIVRIEQYGAFCQLVAFGRLQGLIHISQLANIKVEKVEDVVSLDDHVWVKVLEATTVPQDDQNNMAGRNHDGAPPRPRLRIKLSLKDVSQDGTCVDFGQQRQVQEDVRNQIESNLNSMIGMAVARDPMADRLQYKRDTSSNKQTFRGGYTLVGDDEGEPEEPPDTVVVPPLPGPPVGRGRGATLPAWMTSNLNGPTGGPSEGDESGSDHDRTEKKRKSHKSSRHKHSRKEKKHKKKRRRHTTRDNDDSFESESDNSRYRRERRRRKDEKSELRKKRHKRSSRDGGGVEDDRDNSD